MVSVIKSVRRVAEVLEEFDRQRRPLRLKEICEQLGCAPSSGAAVLKSMVALGYLGYDRRTRTYLPTMRIVVFGEWLPQELFSRFNMLATLEELAAKTGLHAFIATQSDLYAQYVHVIGSDRPGKQINAKTGTLRAIAWSSAGRLLMSTQSDQDVEKLVRRINFFERRPSMKVDLAELRPILAEIRKQGYIFTRDFVTPGVGILAMPLPSEVFDRTMAIGIGAEIERVEENVEFYLDTLRGAIADIARAREDEVKKGSER